MCEAWVLPLRSGQGRVTTGPFLCAAHTLGFWPPGPLWNGWWPAIPSPLILSLHAACSDPTTCWVVQPGACTCFSPHWLSLLDPRYSPPTPTPRIPSASCHLVQSLAGSCTVLGGERGTGEHQCGPDTGRMRGGELAVYDPKSRHLCLAGVPRQPPDSPDQMWVRVRRTGCCCCSWGRGNSDKPQQSRPAWRSDQCPWLELGGKPGIGFKMRLKEKAHELLAQDGMGGRAAAGVKGLALVQGAALLGWGRGMSLSISVSEGSGTSTSCDQGTAWVGARGTGKGRFSGGCGRLRVVQWGGSREGAAQRGLQEGWSRGAAAGERGAPLGGGEEAGGWSRRAAVGGRIGPAGAREGALGVWSRGGCSGVGRTHGG